MNKKIYLLSFAAAAMFASCSNEMEEFKTNSDQGFKVNIQIAKDASETRLAASEDGKKYTWELGDKFSLFNVGATVPASAFTASANAAYKTTDGENFASENVLFNGYHALVFPINYNYVTAGTNIEVAPITEGSETLGNRSVILGKNVVEITADGLKDDKGNKFNQSGYNKNIKMGARVASTAFVFNLKSDKPLALTENDPAMKVNKVELISTGEAFATKANLTAGSKGEIIATPVTTTTTAKVEYKNGLTFDAAGTKAIIVALPNTVVTTGTAQLKLYTNYGIVTIADAAQVSQVKDGKTLIQLATPAEKPKDYKATAMSFNSEVKVLAEKAAAGAAVPNVLRDVQVDFSQTDINGMEIKNSADLIAAYRAYDLLGKSYAEFTLQGESFELTKDAVKAINDHALTAKDNKTTGVKLTCAATTITLSGFGADYVTVPAIDQISGKTLVLAADSKWTIDVQNASKANAFTAIVNKGTLKLSQGTQAKNEQALALNIENDGTIEFAGNVDVPVAINDTKEVDKDKKIINAGTINVADGQTVNLKGGADIAVGTINVGSTANSTAILASSNKEIVTLGADVTTNVYGSLLNEKDATLTNAGVINIKDANAGVIITENSGIVNVTAKDNYVTIGTQNGYTKLVVTDAKFEVKTANMGVANYVVFKGSELNIAENNFSVSLCETAKVTESVKDAATVKEFNVAKGKMITIPAGSSINANKTYNLGTIRVYGQFNAGTVSEGESNIYRY